MSILRDKLHRPLKYTYFLINVYLYINYNLVYQFDLYLLHVLQSPTLCGREMSLALINLHVFLVLTFVESCKIWSNMYQVLYKTMTKNQKIPWHKRLYTHKSPLLWWWTPCIVKGQFWSFHIVLEYILKPRLSQSIQKSALSTSLFPTSMRIELWEFGTCEHVI